LTVRSRALGAFEPRQVRKEAALRSVSQVPRNRLTRARSAGAARAIHLEDAFARPGLGFSASPTGRTELERAPAVRAVDGPPVLLICLPDRRPMQDRHGERDPGGEHREGTDDTDERLRRRRARDTADAKTGECEPEGDRDAQSP